MPPCNHKEFVPTCPFCQSHRTGKVKDELSVGIEIYRIAEQVEAIHNSEGFTGVSRWLYERGFRV